MFYVVSGLLVTQCIIYSYHCWHWGWPHPNKRDVNCQTNWTGTLYLYSTISQLRTKPNFKHALYGIYVLLELVSTSFEQSCYDCFVALLQYCIRCSSLCQIVCHKATDPWNRKLLSWSNLTPREWLLLFQGSLNWWDIYYTIKRLSYSTIFWSPQLHFICVYEMWVYTTLKRGLSFLWCYTSAPR